MQGDTLLTVFQILVLIFSVVIHEVSHGLMAERLGDPTARRAGRLTLNPLRHIDPIGSIIVPLLTFLTGGVVFGWAKPVPYNPYNLRNGKRGEAMVALAGPASNIAIAIFFSLVIRLNGSFFTFSDATLTFVSLVIIINLVLAFFNLIPIPPLDGSKILFSFLPLGYERVRAFLERYSLILFLLVIFVFWDYLSILVFYVFRAFTGISF